MHAGVRGPVVLVGHSMGGRVAMRAATLPEAASNERQQGAPPYLAAVVIEDMDLRVRQVATNPDPKPKLYRTRTPTLTPTLTLTLTPP